MRPLYLLWWLIAVLIIALTRSWLDPETFSGNVVATIVGAILTAAVAALFFWIGGVFRRHKSLDGRFSDKVLNQVLHVGFTPETAKKHTVYEGCHRFCFGVNPGKTVRVRRIDIRPMERTWIGTWTNLRVPYPLTLVYKNSGELQQRQLHGNTFTSVVPINHHGAGFNCLTHALFTLDDSQVFWFDVEVTGHRGWRGAISVCIWADNGDRVFCRRRFDVIPDDRTVTSREFRR